MRDFQILFASLRRELVQAWSHRRPEHVREGSVRQFHWVKPHAARILGQGDQVVTDREIVDTTFAESASEDPENMTRKEPQSLASLTAVGRRLLNDSHDPTRAHSEFGYWDHQVAEWLDAQFPETGLSARWTSISTSPLVSGRYYSDDEGTWAAFGVAVQKRISFLGGLGAASGPRTAEGTTKAGAANKRRVFVVHGHDETAREKVARYVEKLGLEAVILHEQPSCGRTIIEKFEGFASVGFAVVLLTPDDVGRSAQSKQLSPRPRQNVILELGFFCGALGRGRVCALVKGDLEIPSDYSGVVYVTLDDGGAWKPKLASEMKAAGLTVDLNDAI